MSILYFLNQPETRSLTVLLLLAVITPILAAYTSLFPPILWLSLTSNYVYLFLYFIFVCFITRLIARGGTYSEINKLNLKGKTYLITGSAGGLGKQTAIQLAKRGARVILFARQSNLQQAIDDVKKQSKSEDNVIGFPLDLSDLSSIKKCVDLYHQSEGKDAQIRALINNAGVMACPYKQTKDGFEMQMGTNHFGHFYLTKLLLPQLRKSKSRVVNVSSTGHALWQVPCTPETYAQQLNEKTYNPMNAYSLSKIANIYFAIELDRRFGLQAYSLHPGAVNTELQRYMGFLTVLRPLTLLIFKTPLEGAQTQLYCALADGVRPGEYFADCKQKAYGNPHAADKDKAKEWWDYSEKMLSEKLK
ncbi:unnamed protein product [Didymodactylos carnosus]|uniref:Uncharacterized protein n=1 Tax=Didymodactylos carnosus TaxID=1234261 RepID=A0A815F5C5_9BILA|nr:unnamed protein product [Didymodactylos carnosus]CAF1391442.1 unnamed protein product [Didymodactylos carnosus]CAF4163195.1 unnamed protein product [Didymodactylos carnosus]CAF4199094.1 unnamed protein product [Didymodactylos carnosus]